MWRASTNPGCATPHCGPLTNRLGGRSGPGPQWKLFYKPHLKKRTANLQWRIWHGAIASNSFISVLNPAVLSTCPFCILCETVFFCFYKSTRDSHFSSIAAQGSLPVLKQRLSHSLSLLFSLTALSLSIHPVSLSLSLSLFLLIFNYKPILGVSLPLSSLFCLLLIVIVSIFLSLSRVLSTISSLTL